MTPDAGKSIEELVGSAGRLQANDVQQDLLQLKQNLDKLKTSAMQSEIEGDLFTVMMEYQKASNREAREDRANVRDTSYIRRTTRMAPDEDD